MDEETDSSLSQVELSWRPGALRGGECIVDRAMSKRPRRVTLVFSSEHKTKAIRKHSLLWPPIRKWEQSCQFQLRLLTGKVLAVTLLQHTEASLVPRQKEHLCANTWPFLLTYEVLRLIPFPEMSSFPSSAASPQFLVSPRGVAQTSHHTPDTRQESESQISAETFQG